MNALESERDWPAQMPDQWRHKAPRLSDRAARLAYAEYERQHTADTLGVPLGTVNGWRFRAGMHLTAAGRRAAIQKRSGGR